MVEQRASERINRHPTRLGPLRRIVTLGTVLAAAGCAGVPEAITAGEFSRLADDRSARVVGAEQEPVTGPIGLYEAMARAIKYNLDHQVELKEEALRLREFELAEYELLPDLVANAGYTGRGNEPGASSISLLTGTVSLEPSRSTEEDLFEADLSLSYDVLDFAVSYVRARQKGDEVLIALEQRRSAINRIVENVRTAFWRAVSAERLLHRLRRLERDVEAQLAQAEAQARGREAEPFEALVFQRELLEVQRSTQELARDLAVAKAQLAALMNLRPGTHYELHVPKRGAAPPHVNASAEQLSQIAFRNRPELREISYRLRINDREIDAAIAEALPSVRGFLGGNTSSNDLLFNQSWVNYGARASWNLMNLVRLPQRQRTIDASEEALDARALALTQAVATQVFVARMRFHSLRRELRTASRYNRVNRQIAQQTRAQFSAGAVGNQILVREELNAILAELRFDVTFSEVQNAYAQLYAAVGLDPYEPGLTGEESVDELAASLARLWSQRGDPLGRLSH